MLKKHVLNKSESGQSLIELALTMTFMLILLSGVMDFGRAFFTYIALRDAAQEGALYASYKPQDCAGIIKRTRETSNMPIPLDDTTKVKLDIKINLNACSPTATGLNPGQPIDVTITYENFQLATPFLGTLIGTQEFDLKATIKNTILVDPTP